MRMLQRLGILCSVFGLVVMGAQAWVDVSFLQSHTELLRDLTAFRGVLTIFAQALWTIFFAGSLAMAFESYWGRWAVALSSLLLLGELLTFDILPSFADGLGPAVGTMAITWPGVVLGRGPITFLILLAVTYTVIAKGLARRPSSERRGAEGERLRTRETDRPSA